MGSKPVLTEQIINRRSILARSLGLAVAGSPLFAFFSRSLGGLDVDPTVTVKYSYFLPEGMTPHDFIIRSSEWVDGDGLRSFLAAKIASGEIKTLNRTYQPDRAEYEFKFVNDAAFRRFKSEVVERGLVDASKRTRLGIAVRLSEIHRFFNIA